MSRIDSDLQVEAMSLMVAMKSLSAKAAALQHEYDVLLIENEQQREELHELRKLKAR